MMTRAMQREFDNWCMLENDKLRLVEIVRAFTIKTRKGPRVQFELSSEENTEPPRAAGPNFIMNEDYTFYIHPGLYNKYFAKMALVRGGIYNRSNMLSELKIPCHLCHRPRMLYMNLHCPLFPDDAPYTSTHKQNLSVFCANCAFQMGGQTCPFCLERHPFLTWPF